MDWSKGFSAAYYVAVVDPVTWRDIDRLEIKGGSVTRTATDLRGAADLEMVRYDHDKERWLRVWLNVRQNNDSAHVALFTGLASSPSRKIDGKLVTNDVQLYSVLKPAEDVLLPPGWYAPAKTRSGTIIGTLLSVSPAPVTIDDNSPILQEAIIAEEGESRLTMVDKILTAINWRMRVSGDGGIHICPKPTDISASFDAMNNDSVETQIDMEYDWYACPNVYRVISDGFAATARDDSADSPLSTVNRGREIWKQESSGNLNEGESLADYAKRRLKEEQNIALKVKYKRRFHPEIFPGDIIQLHYPPQGLEGIYHVTSQAIDLGYGATTSEEVTRNE